MTCSHETVPTAPFSSSPGPKHCWDGKAETLPCQGLEPPSPTCSHRHLTCNAMVKWLVFVSRTILVFMADWMPHRHCKYPMVFLSRLRARTMVRPGRTPRDENCRAQFVLMKLGEKEKASSGTKYRLLDGLKFPPAQKPCPTRSDYLTARMTPDSSRNSFRLY